MERDEEKILEYEAYNEIFNIELFNDIVNFIIFTTPKDSGSLLNFLEINHIWFKRKSNANIPFKYLGELLERYKEKLGTDIKDIRAIALALAYTKDVMSEQMIVGKQEINFIKDIEKLASNDVYLKATLYLYDSKKYYSYNKELKEYNYERTEDIIFVISIFDDFKEGFYMFKEQLKKLIGNKKTIEVFDNIGIFNWLIKKLYPIINKSRSKDDELFRGLINIPTALIKKDNKTYNILKDSNYSNEEIAYLNYAVLQYRPVPKTVRIGRSIVEEKIAVNMCEILLNSEKDYSDNIYNYIKNIISKYKKFDIKCNGYQRIKDALENSVNIKNPRTFIELYEIMDRKIFSFDILDEKWDIIATEFEFEDYRNLFDNYLLFNNYNREHILQAIEKYNKLANSLYIDSFYIFHYRREGIYSKLVEADIIDLKEYYLTYINSKEKYGNIEHLKNYVSKIYNRKAFLFLKYFLQEHTIEETDNLGFNLKWMYSLGSYYPEINIKRDFLSPEENKELFYWINEYVFKKSPELYIKFITCTLKTEYFTLLFTEEELRNIYLTLVKIDTNIFKDKELKERYLTKQELEEENRKEKEYKLQQEKLKLQEKKKEIIKQFNNVKGSTFKDIFEFYDRCSWDDKGQKIKAKLIIKYFNSNISEHKVNKDELINLNKICHQLLNDNTINIDIYGEYLKKYLKERRKEVCKVC